jgi:hypothetical protein
MTVPNARIRKTDGNTGVVRPGADGICAIIAPSATGTANQAASYAKGRTLGEDFGGGLLPEFGAWMLQFTEKPIVAVRATASVAAALSAVSHVGAGTSVVTATGTPVDDYQASVKIVAGGTIGVAGATYQVTLDGGVSWSPVTALGVATSIALLTPTGGATGITVAFAAGTLLAAQTETFTATAARMNNADLVLALEALRVSSLPFESILVAGPLDATMAATIAAWRLLRDSDGRYYSWASNWRPQDEGESDAAYLIAIVAALGNSADQFGMVHGGSFDCASPLTGLLLRRDASLAVMTRAMSIPIGQMPSLVSAGPLVGVSIKDTRGNPKYYDEALSPGLDAARFASLRSFPDRPGAYVNLPRLFSAPGSDYVFYPHARVMNRACKIAKDMLTERLSMGVRKDENGHILEVDALEIDQLITETLMGELGAHCTGVGLILSRTDDLASNGEKTLTGELWCVPLVYVTGFDVNALFRRTIPATA